MRVSNQLPEQHAFGHETDFRFARRDVFKTDLVADFAAKRNAQFLSNPCGEQARLVKSTPRARLDTCRRSTTSTKQL